MPLPFVSRRAFDEVSAALRRESARVDALTAQLVTMRREGFAPAPEKPAPIAREIDPVADAIKDASEGDVALARHLAGVATRLKAQGKPVEEIVRLVTTWESE